MHERRQAESDADLQHTDVRHRGIQCARTATLTSSAPQNGALSKKVTDAILAVQNTCKTGNLYNYGTAASPTSAGTATLSNPVNTAGILDYAAHPGRLHGALGHQDRR